MGKFPNSDIHDKYSDWHYQIIERIDPKYQSLYVSDIDRGWIEYDFERKAIVGFFDLKYEYSSDSVTATEEGIYNCLEEVGFRVYIVFITKNFDRFRVTDRKGLEMILTEVQYADFLLALRNEKKYNKFIEKHSQEEIKKRMAWKPTERIVVDEKPLHIRNVIQNGGELVYEIEGSKGVKEINHKTLYDLHKEGRLRLCYDGPGEQGVLFN